MTIISPILATTLLIAAGCDGFGLLSPSASRNNVPATFRAPLSRYAPTIDINTQHGHHLRHHQITRTKTLSSLNNRQKTSRRTKLFSAASLPMEEDERNDGNKKSNARSHRPDWALPWMPTWLITLRPITQFVVGLGLYIFHLRILTQHGITFPFQLIPNDEGWFQSIGLDSLAGMFSLFGMIWLRKSAIKHAAQGNDINIIVPSVWSDPTYDEAPWKLRRPKRRNKNNKSKRDNGNEDTSLDKVHHPRSTSIVAFVLLTAGYFSTGRFSLLFENALYAAAGYGLPLTVPMHRSLVVLLGHLAWVLVGSGILATVLSPKPFFGGGWKKNEKKKEKVLQPFRWYTNKWDTYWLWWTIGGYFVSAWLFNIADWMNQIILPPYLFAEQSEGVVSQLINPENNDFLASLMGYIAPCLSAPWWEEVLYRGYLLPALRLFMGFKQSVFVSGVLFSVHHLSIMGAIPLAVLGWFWAALYAKSGNLLVTILIHGMWNSRVFLGSWLGL
jgi:membrane protease YdiL (CAAX protease family)